MAGQYTLNGNFTLINEKPVHNYRTRFCSNIAQAKAIIETM